ARGDCPTCRRGEAMAFSELHVPPGVSADGNSPPCGDERFNRSTLPAELRVAAAAAFYSQGANPADASFAMGFTEQVVAGLSALVEEVANQPGAFARALLQANGQRDVSSCSRLVVTLPQTVHIKRIEKSMPCSKGGWCGFSGEPITDQVDENLF